MVYYPDIWGGFNCKNPSHFLKIFEKFVILHSKFSFEREPRQDLCDYWSWSKRNLKQRSQMNIVEYWSLPWIIL